MISNPIEQQIAVQPALPMVLQLDIEQPEEAKTERVDAHDGSAVGSTAGRTDGSTDGSTVEARTEPDTCKVGSTVGSKVASRSDNKPPSPPGAPSDATPPAAEPKDPIAPPSPPTPDEVASFNQLGVAVELDTERLGAIWLVPEYTDNPRREISSEDYAKVIAIRHAIPGTEVSRFKMLDRDVQNPELWVATDLSLLEDEQVVGGEGESIGIEGEQQNADTAVPADRNKGDHTYRLLDAQYYAWLRLQMNRARSARERGNLADEAWKEMCGRFNRVHDWAMKYIGEGELRDAVRQFDGRRYVAPVSW